MKYFLSLLIFSSCFFVFFIFASHFFTTDTFAATSSNCAETAKGKPLADTQGGCGEETTTITGTDCTSSAINCAALIIKTLQPVCPHPKETGALASLNKYAYIDRTDWSCVPPTNIAANVKAGLKQSVDENYYLQCLGFVQTVGLATGHPVRTKDGGLYPYAVNVWSNPPPKYKVIPVSSGNPQVGDIVVFSGYTAGHIAYVSATYPNNKVQLAEANGNGHGSLDYLIYNITGSTAGLTILGWLRPI